MSLYGRWRTQCGRAMPSLMCSMTTGCTCLLAKLLKLCTCYMMCVRLCCMYFLFSEPITKVYKR